MFGDAINIMLAAAKYNFKRAMTVFRLCTILPLVMLIFQKNPITQII